MDLDLEQYSEIIEQLKPMVNEPEFNQILAQVAKDLPNEKRFLIKMEVKRQAKPCVRSIDLRGQVDGDCRLFEFEGIRHYLDDTAIDVFEQQVRIFGRYCFGVYEAVLQTENNFKVIRERQEKRTNEASSSLSTIDKYSVDIVNLMDYSQRQSERMNFSVSVEVFNQHNASVRGSTVDISTTGIQVKINRETLFKVGERVTVFYRGFEEEFAMDKSRGVAYIVVKIARKKEIQYVALQRDKEIAHPTFDQFLENFIHGNKRRYKVNMKNTIDAIVNKICEQYFTPRSPALPVYLDVKDTIITPRYAMVNDVNREITDYWQDEHDNDRLGFLLNAQRLKLLTTKPAAEKVLYVFSFTHLADEKVYFYSASLEELEHYPALRSVFIGFGARKASWRVYKLVMTEMSPQQAHAPLSIPDSVGTKVKRMNTPPAPRLMAKLKDLGLLVHITDVTTKDGQNTYATWRFDRARVSQLKVFGHPRNKPSGEIKTFRYKHENHRMESRYRLRSAIVLSVKGMTRTYTGISEDISVHGLRIELDDEYIGSTDSQVQVGFPKLQALTKSHDIMALNYVIVHYNEAKNILHLRSVEGDAGESARRFFDELIKRNKQSLKAYPDEEEIPGIGRALRVINAKNATSLAFVLAKDGVRYSPQFSIVGKHDDRLTRLATHFAGDKQVNLEFMYRDRKLDSPFVQHAVKQIKTDNMPLRQELYVAFDPSQKDKRLAIVTHYSHRFSNQEQRKTFINEALNKGQFIALHIALTTTGKPDLDLVQAEINYVSVYAIHRAKELEEIIWKITACAHLCDITDEVLTRFQFDSTVIDKNRDAALHPAVNQHSIQALLQ